MTKNIDKPHATHLVSQKVSQKAHHRGNLDEAVVNLRQHCVVVIEGS